MGKKEQLICPQAIVCRGIPHIATSILSDLGNSDVLLSIIDQETGC